MSNHFQNARRNRRIRTAIVLVIIIPTALFAVLPFVLLILSSFKTLEEYYALDFHFFPQKLQWGNYADVFREKYILRWTVNTLIITFSVTAICTISSIIVSYGFAKYRCRLNNILFMVLLSTMMIPWAVTMIPSFSIWAKLSLVDTYAPLIIPCIGGSVFYIFMFRQFMMGIPKELSEAARMDGCNSFRILWRIIVPNMIPAIMTMIIFTAMGQWGDFTAPYIYLSDVTKFTLSLGINMLRPQLGGYTPWPMLLAASTLFALPVLFLYFFGTKVFKNGFVVSSLK